MAERTPLVSLYSQPLGNVVRPPPTGGQHLAPSSPHPLSVDPPKLLVSMAIQQQHQPKKQQKQAHRHRHHRPLERLTKSHRSVDHQHLGTHKSRTQNTHNTQLQSPSTVSPLPQTARSQSPRLQIPHSQSLRSQSRSPSHRSQSPHSQSPHSQSPHSQSPHSQSPHSQSTSLQSPSLQSPSLQTPSLQTPSLQTPSLQTPSLQTPRSRSPRSQSSPPQKPEPQEPRQQSPDSKQPRSQEPCPKESPQLFLPQSVLSKSPHPQPPLPKSPRLQSPRSQSPCPPSPRPQSPRPLIAKPPLPPSVKVGDATTHPIPVYSPIPVPSKLTLPVNIVHTFPNTPPASPRIVRPKLSTPENPPPYEQIFNVITEEESITVEGPSASKRKEKKRSLRNRLLRHLTGKRAAAAAARASSVKMTSGSYKQKNPSPAARPTAGCTQLIIQPVLDECTANGHIIHNETSSPPQLHQSIINEKQFINMHYNYTFPIQTEVSKNGYTIVLSTTPKTETPPVLNRCVSNQSESNGPSNTTHKTVNITQSQPQSRVPSPTVSQVTIPSQSASQSSVFISNNLEAPKLAQNPQVRRNTVTSSSFLQHSQNKVTQSYSVNSYSFSNETSQTTSHKSNEERRHSDCSQRKLPEESQPASSVTIPPQLIHINQKRGTPDNITNIVTNGTEIQSGVQGQSKCYTINLKPGMYKLNIRWPNRKKGGQPQTINITVPQPSDIKDSVPSSVQGPPPAVPEQLYYDSTPKFSIPQRFIHLLRPALVSSKTSNSRSAPKVTIIQQGPDNSGSQVITLVSPGEKHQQVIEQDVNRGKAHKKGLSPFQARHNKKDKHRLAERKKAEGNEAYRNKEYRDALHHYTQAIDMCPECAAYYSNRSACYMMLGKYRDALSDAQRAVTLDKTFVKGWLRVGKCHIALGDGAVAVSVLKHAQGLEPATNAALLAQEIVTAQALQKCVEESLKARDKKDYRTAMFHLDQALRYALGSPDLRISKAEYLTYLGRFTDAEDIVNEILVSDANHADALYVRGLCRYYQDNQDAAFQHFTKVLRLVPDHQKAKDTYKRAKLLIQKKEQGNVAFKMGDFARAMGIYSEALEIDHLNKSTNAKLYCNRATVAAKLGRSELAIADCTAALLLDEGYVKAYLRRANTYQQSEQYEEAVRDYEKVYRLQRSQEHKRLLQDAKAQLKRSKRKDYYKILGVSKTATDDEIKKAYRKMALLHHPDRHSSATAAEKAEHEKKFKELGEAYAVLTDPKKRGMHDRGQDVNDPECAGFSREAGSFDPNQVFEAFFGPDFFASQSHHYYDGQHHHQQQQQQQVPPHQQQQFQGAQFQSQPGFHGAFPGMQGGFQFGF